MVRDAKAVGECTFIRWSQEMIRRAERFTQSAERAGVATLPASSSPSPSSPVGPTVNGMPHTAAAASGPTSVQTARSGVRSPLHRTASPASASASASPSAPAAASSNPNAVGGGSRRRRPSDGALKRAPSDHLLRSALTPRSAQANYRVNPSPPSLFWGMYPALHVGEDLPSLNAPIRIAWY